jgi:hypothetical protein
MDQTHRQLLTLLLCLRTLPGIGFTQTRDGFLGHHWGTPAATLAQAVELRTPRAEGEVILYNTAVAEIDHVAVQQCDLEFVSGRLAGVIVTVRGEENSRQFLALLQKEYGEGKSNHPRARTWTTPNTRASYDEDTHGDAYIYWYSTLLQH